LSLASSIEILLRTASPAAVMSVWTSRRDARGAHSFISYTATTIDVLAPPGSEFDDRSDGRPAGGTGLWTWARWERDDDTLLDVDEPLAYMRLRTAAVLARVGDGFRAEIGAIMREQLDHAWMLCDPHPARLVEDRRTRRHAAMLMQLSSEISEAFPDEDLWRTAEFPTGGVPDNYDEFLRLLPGGREHTPVMAANSVSTWVIVFALARVLLARACGRRRMTRRRPGRLHEAREVARRPRRSIRSQRAPRLADCERLSVPRELPASQNRASVGQLPAQDFPPDNRLSSRE